MNAPLPDRNLRIEDQADDILGAMACWGEARNQSAIGKLAVLEVIKKRSLVTSWWNRGDPDWSLWKRTILCPAQFSCFNKKTPKQKADPNREKLLTPLRWGSESVWAECYRAAVFVCHADIWQPSDGVARGADHYHHRLVWPSWAKRSIEKKKIPVAVHGDHVFWRIGAAG